MVCHEILYCFGEIEIKMFLFNLFSFISFFLLIDITSALYFHIAEGERKCFIEEIPDDTTVIGKLVQGVFLFWVHAESTQIS